MSLVSGGHQRLVVQRIIGPVRRVRPTPALMIRLLKTKAEEEDDVLKSRVEGRWKVSDPNVVNKRLSKPKRVEYGEKKYRRMSGLHDEALRLQSVFKATEGIGLIRTPQELDQRLEWLKGLHLWRERHEFREDVVSRALFNLVNQEGQRNDALQVAQSLFADMRSVPEGVYTIWIRYADLLHSTKTTSRCGQELLEELYHRHHIFIPLEMMKGIMSTTWKLGSVEAMETCLDEYLGWDPFYTTDLLPMVAYNYAMIGRLDTAFQIMGTATASKAPSQAMADSWLMMAQSYYPGMESVALQMRSKLQEGWYSAIASELDDGNIAAVTRVFEEMERVRNAWVDTGELSRVTRNIDLLLLELSVQNRMGGDAIVRQIEACKGYLTNSDDIYTGRLALAHSRALLQEQQVDLSTIEGTNYLIDFIMKRKLYWGVFNPNYPDPAIHSKFYAMILQHQQAMRGELTNPQFTVEDHKTAARIVFKTSAVMARGYREWIQWVPDALDIVDSKGAAAVISHTWNEIHNKDASWSHINSHPLMFYARHQFRWGYSDEGDRATAKALYTVTAKELPTVRSMVTRNLDECEGRFLPYEDVMPLGLATIDQMVRCRNDEAAARLSKALLSVDNNRAARLRHNFMLEKAQLDQDGEYMFNSAQEYNLNLLQTWIRSTLRCIPEHDPQRERTVHKMARYVSQKYLSTDDPVSKEVQTEVVRTMARQGHQDLMLRFNELLSPQALLDLPNGLAAWLENIRGMDTEAGALSILQRWYKKYLARMESVGHNVIAESPVYAKSAGHDFVTIMDRAGWPVLSTGQKNDQTEHEPNTALQIIYDHLVREAESQGLPRAFITGIMSSLRELPATVDERALHFRAKILDTFFDPAMRTGIEILGISEAQLPAMLAGPLNGLDKNHAVFQRLKTFPRFSNLFLAHEWALGKDLAERTGKGQVKLIRHIESVMSLVNQVQPVSSSTAQEVVSQIPLSLHAPSFLAVLGRVRTYTSNIDVILRQMIHAHAGTKDSWEKAMHFHLVRIVGEATSASLARPDQMKMLAAMHSFTSETSLKGPARQLTGVLIEGFEASDLNILSAMLNDPGNSEHNLRQLYALTKHLLYIFSSEIGQFEHGQSGSTPASSQQPLWSVSNFVKSFNSVSFPDLMNYLMAMKMASNTLSTEQKLVVNEALCSLMVNAAYNHCRMTALGKNRVGTTDLLERPMVTQYLPMVYVAQPLPIQHSEAKQLRQIVGELVRPCKSYIGQDANALDILYSCISCGLLPDEGSLLTLVNSAARIYEDRMRTHIYSFREADQYWEILSWLASEPMGHVSPELYDAFFKHALQLNQDATLFTYQSIVNEDIEEEQVRLSRKPLLFLRAILDRIGGHVNEPDRKEEEFIEPHEKLPPLVWSATMADTLTELLQQGYSYDVTILLQRMGQVGTFAHRTNEDAVDNPEEWLCDYLAYLLHDNERSERIGAAVRLFEATHLHGEGLQPHRETLAIFVYYFYRQGRESVNQLALVNMWMKLAEAMGFSEWSRDHWVDVGSARMRSAYRSWWDLNDSRFLGTMEYYEHVTKRRTQQGEVLQKVLDASASP
eukprot:Clim_evm60s136 gene=Clim_evmTU60s136